MIALHYVSSLKQGDWTDFQSNSGKWYNAQVTQRKDDQIEVKWIAASYSICGNIYDRVSLKIELRYIYIFESRSHPRRYLKITYLCTYTIFSKDQILRFAPSRQISMAENKSNIECRIGNKVDLSCDGFQDCEGWRSAQILSLIHI